MKLLTSGGRAQLASGRAQITNDPSACACCGGGYSGPPADECCDYSTYGGTIPPFDERCGYLTDGMGDPIAVGRLVADVDARISGRVLYVADDNSGAEYPAADEPDFDFSHNFTRDATDSPPGCTNLFANQVDDLGTLQSWVTGSTLRADIQAEISLSLVTAGVHRIRFRLDHDVLTTVYNSITGDDVRRWLSRVDIEYDPVAKSITFIEIRANTGTTDAIGSYSATYTAAKPDICAGSEGLRIDFTLDHTTDLSAIPNGGGSVRQELSGYIMLWVEGLVPCVVPGDP